ncbi:MAG: HlyD family efflux transporter periplasmic adaptor subunit [Firmicutes bacterium]|jgi:HlyD family secretion protein|nr:HlyD family efflux transporter periplasmic adaptor subunit [Bacillota bacterium]
MTEPIIVKKPKKRRQTRTKNLGLYVFTLVIIAGIFFAAYRYFFPKEDKFVLDFYTYAEVGTMDFIDKIATGGTVTPEIVIEIKAPAAATVMEILVAEGDDVNEGTSLLRLSSQKLIDDHAKAVADLEASRQSLAQLVEEQAYEITIMQEKVASAQNKLRTQQANYELQSTLYEYGVIAKAELDRALQEVTAAQRDLRDAERELATTIRAQEKALEQAENSVANIEAELKSLTEIIASLDITAPISGRVLDLKARKDVEVQEASILLTIADLSTQFVKAQISVANAERFMVGSPAEIVTGQNRFPAVVTYISPQAQQTQEGAMVDVHLELETDPSLFRPYSNVTANIHLGIYRNSLYLPRGTYLTSGQQLFVYVIEGSKAARRDVRFGLIEGNNIQILSGLERGDRVITSSYDQYRHLDEIEILPEGGRAQ